MADIRHRIGITAPQTQVQEALTTVEGLSGWWTRQVDGNPDQGGRLHFFVGGTEPGAVMEVVERTPDRVAWRCVEGPDDWVGTSVTYDLKPSGEETVVLFNHADWREPAEFMHHCSTKWGVFLVGLKAGLEGGTATPYPEDGTISSWG